MISFSFIREQRQAKGLSQEQLANQAKVEVAYLSRLERDSLLPLDPAPTLAMMERLYIFLK